MMVSQNNTLAKAFRWCVVLLWLCLVSSPVFSNEVISIIAYDIEGIHQSDGQGKYDLVIAAVMPIEYRYEISINPPNRALRNFEQCSACCLTPMNNSKEFYNYEKTHNAIELESLNNAVGYIFTKAGSKAITHIEELANKKIVHRRGMSFGRRFEHGAKALDIEIIAVNGFDSLFRMLETDRIDAALAYMPDAALYLDERENFKPVRSIMHPVVVHKDALICRNLPADFLQSVDRNIANYKKSEAYRQLMGKSMIAVQLVSVDDFYDDSQ